MYELPQEVTQFTTVLLLLVLKYLIKVLRRRLNSNDKLKPIPSDAKDVSRRTIQTKVVRPRSPRKSSKKAS